MRLQKASYAGLDTPQLPVYRLPSQIVDRGERPRLISVICAVTSVSLTAVNYEFQPEFAAVWRTPHCGCVSLAAILLSIGFLAVQRSGRLTKHQLLDLGRAVCNCG
jgi:hypothetical protein